MKKVAFIVIFSALCIITAASAEEKAGDGACLSCHGKDTPLVIKSWSESAHAKNDIGCGECHEGDYDIGHMTGEDRGIVEAYVCARCHADVSKGHFSGKHGISFRAGRACTRNMNKTPEIHAGCNDCHEKGSRLPRQEVECARFLAQSPEMQRQGCLSCHKVENRCDACHSAHDTDLAIVRDPAVCATCHMGPDHPQYEMWKTSRHGIMFNLKGRDYSPDCNTCHMPEGNHNVSTGITMGLAGQEYPEQLRESQRAKMLEVCLTCHTNSFSMRSLEDGDAIQLQAKAIVDEAASIIRKLDEDGLLSPSPAVRPAHPLSGNKLEIGPQMLYEDLSRVEAVFFRMKKFYYVITYKGAFHQNPDYAHWYGNAPLKLALSEIKSEAALLRELKSLRERVDNLSAFGKTGTDNDQQSPVNTLKTNLGYLRELHLRGDLSEEEFRKRKNDLLDRHGL
jgi:hypothetical protein